MSVFYHILHALTRVLISSYILSLLSLWVPTVCVLTSFVGRPPVCLMREFCVAYFSDDWSWRLIIEKIENISRVNSFDKYITIWRCKWSHVFLSLWWYFLFVLFRFANIVINQTHVVKCHKHKESVIIRHNYINALFTLFTLTYIHTNDQYICYFE